MIVPPSELLSSSGGICRPLQISLSDHRVRPKEKHHASDEQFGNRVTKLDSYGAGICLYRDGLRVCLPCGRADGRSFSAGRTPNQTCRPRVLFLSALLRRNFHLRRKQSESEGQGRSRRSCGQQGAPDIRAPRHQPSDDGGTQIFRLRFGHPQVGAAGNPAAATADGQGGGKGSKRTRSVYKKAVRRVAPRE